MHKRILHKLFAFIMTATVTAASVAMPAQAETIVDSLTGNVSITRESDSTREEIEEVEAELSELANELSELNTKKADKISEMKDRIAYLYVNNSGGMLEAILGAENFADALNSVAQQKELYEYNAEQLAEYEELISEVEEKQTELNDKLTELYSLLDTQVQSETGINLVSEALKYLGTPYVWGGTTTSGFDCSGFVYYCVNQCGNGWSMSRTNAEGIRKKCTAVSKSDLQPGDLIFFQGTYSTSGASHIAIYIGDNMMVHAASGGVKISSINETYWVKHLMQYGRLNL